MSRIDLRPMPQSYQTLLDRATELFQADERVRAVWLHGAIASGAQDAGSDLDIDIAVRDQDFDAFTAESAAWWAKITPTVSRRELPQMPGSFFALTPMCARVDVITERVSALSTSRLTRRVTIFDRDGLTARLDRKRRTVTVAEASIPHARVVWGRDTIHDAQLQRTE